MAAKGDSKPEVEVYTGVSELMHTIEELSEKINEMLALVKSSKSGAEIKALLVQVKVQKNNQEGVKKRFYEFMTEFCESHDYQNPEVFRSTDKGFEELKVAIEVLKKEEDDVKERTNDLMVKFGKSKVSSDSDVKYRSEFKDVGLKGVNIRDNIFLKPENWGDSMIVDFGKTKIEGPDVKESIEEEKSDDSGHSSDYEFCTGTEGQDDVMSEFEEIEEDSDMKKAMGLEGKMMELMQATKVSFNRDQDVTKKSLVKWIGESEDIDSNEWRSLKRLSDLAFELGPDLCRMLGDLMFRLSEREAVLEKFHEFKSGLESLNEDRSSIVIKGVIGTFEITDEEIRKREEVRLLKKSPTAGKQTDTSEKKGVSDDESIIEKLLLKFYREIYRLDSMMNNPGLPELKRSHPSKAVVKKYKQAVETIDKAVKKLKKESTKIYDSEVLNFNQYRRLMVEFKINELWSNLAESND